MILGPREDAVLEGFHHFCAERGLLSHRVSDPRKLPFILTFGNKNGAGARLSVNGRELSLADVGLFIRGAGHMMHSVLGHPFSKGEYFSALWALASQAPNIVNRPGRWAWESRIAQERHFGEDLLLPRSTSHTTRYFLERLAVLAPSYCQVDVSSVTDRKEFSLDYGAKLSVQPDGLVYRGRFVGQPLYLIEMFVGPRARIILDETERGPSEPSYRMLRDRILAFAGANSLQHFAAVTLFVDGCAHLAKLDAEPPPRWYEEYATDLFDGLLPILLGHETAIASP